MLNNRTLMSAASISKDDYFNYTTLLLHGDGTNGAQNNTFIDSGPNAYTMTRNGNCPQGTFSPFVNPDGYWSMYFDGTNDRLTIADNAVLRPGTSNFTLEAWIYRNASGADHTIYAKGGASTGFVFQVTSTNVLRFTDTTTNIDSTGTINLGEWVHVAAVRSGTGTGQFKLYINGINDGTGTVNTDFNQTEEARIGEDRGATGDFSGYISNVRFVKGTALYTGNFTPATTPLTTTSQGAISTEVELLTCQSNFQKDNSTNNFFITKVNDTAVSPFCPFDPPSVYNASANVGSFYADGTGDYISSTFSSAGVSLDGSNTIEFWTYQTVYGNEYTTNIGSNTPSTNRIGIQFYLDSIYVYYGNLGTQMSSTRTTQAYLKNSWHHIAVVRNVNAVRLYVDGVDIGSVGTVTTNPTTYEVGIGASSSGTVPFFGYISNYRITKSAVYTTAFTPSTTPLTGGDVLLNFTNAGIIDNTGKNVIETAGNAQVNTTIKKYGTGSLSFDGTGDWLNFVTYSNDLYNFGTGNFTIEGWFYRTTTSGRMDLLGRYVDATNGFGVATSLTSSGDMQFYYGNSVLITTPGSVWSANTWTHFAVVRSGTNLQIYVQGIKQNTVTNSTSMSSGNPLVVGAAGNRTQPLNGFLDEIRITKGVARYTANFIPSTAAFPDQ